MGTHNLKITLLNVLSNWRQSKTFCYVTGIALFITLLSCLPRLLSSLSVFDARGELDISLVGEVRPGPSYPDPVLTKRDDFPTLFKTEFLFLIPCLRHLTRNQTLCKTMINMETLSYLSIGNHETIYSLINRVTQAVYRPRKDTENRYPD